MSTLRLWVGIGVVAVAAAGVALVVAEGEDSPREVGGSASPPLVTEGPEEASVERLLDVGRSAGHPVYWAGEQEGRELELTVEPDGKIFVRYLDEGVPVGSPDRSLTIGTYPFRGAFEALEAIARQPGSVAGEAPGGGLVVGDNPRSTNVYLAFPGSDVEIEIFDPAAGGAFAIATSGGIRPIE